MCYQSEGYFRCFFIRFLWYEHVSVTFSPIISQFRYTAMALTDEQCVFQQLVFRQPWGYKLAQENRSGELCGCAV